MQNFLTLRSKHVKETGNGGYCSNFFLILLIDSNKEDFYICRQLLINNFVLKFL